jgi:transcriptional regulator of acetoin/glycerol metabolism
MNNADEMIMHVTQIMGEVRRIEMIARSLAAVWSRCCSLCRLQPSRTQFTWALRVCIV